MRIACVDTSALVSLLFGEPDAASVQAAMDDADVLCAANLVEAELRSVAHREQVDPESLAPVLGLLQWVFPVRSLRGEFERTLDQGHLRGADLWHLACALYVGEHIAPPVLISCDQRQREIAGKLGLAVLP